MSNSSSEDVEINLGKQEQRADIPRPTNLRQTRNESVGCCGGFLVVFSYILFCLTIPFSLCCALKIVEEYKRAVILRLGRLRGGARGPGLFFVLPCTDTYIPVDLRIKTFDVPPQEVLTKDSVTIRVNAVVYYCVFDPVKSVLDVEEYNYATRLLAQTTLRSIIGYYDLQVLLVQRDQISSKIQKIMDEATDPWGVKVDRVEVKDIILPANLQRAMAAEAEAVREANAKVIAASGEQRAAKNLSHAANVMSSSPGALQLRYLQTLNTISAEKNSTIVFPLPLEMLGPLTGLVKNMSGLIQGSPASDSEESSDEESNSNLLVLNEKDQPIKSKKKR